MRDRGAPRRRKLQRRWLELWGRLGATGDGEQAFAELDRRYREPGRWYHNWTHIRECLEVLDRLTGSTEDPQALEMAVWLHDSVYDPRRTDNEQQSALLAGEIARAGGLAASFNERVGGLILATRVGGSAGSRSPGRDAALVRDIDLSILGRPRGRYRNYEAGIRREYGWVPAEEFRRRRGDLLRKLLARPRLYFSTELGRCCEARARRNLRWSLRHLESAYP